MSRCVIAQSAPDLTFLTESDFPPYSYQRFGHIDGIAVRIVRELMLRAGLNVNIEPQPWIRAYRSVLDRPNMGLFPMKRTHSRDDKFYWIGVVAPYPMSVYATDHKLKKRISWLNPKTKLRVGAVNQVYVENVLRQRGFRREVNLFSVNDYPQNVRKLLNNRIDLLPISDFSMQYILQHVYPENNGKSRLYRLFGFKPDKYPVLYLGLSKRSSLRLVIRLRRTLKKMHQDGSYQSIVRHYLYEHHLRFGS
ncbi:MAG: hypothetical protein CENE_01123 [Candidatus Celerinatantimonas neptuna]|nr:MAG: hypothetical protein CENE_01123 [Candidatus Celerinatantimonas neptuna]